MNYSVDASGASCAPRAESPKRPAERSEALPPGSEAGWPGARGARRRLGKSPRLGSLGLLQLGTCCLVAITSAPRAEGRQFDPGQVHYAGRPRPAPAVSAARAHAKPSPSSRPMAGLRGSMEESKGSERPPPSPCRAFAAKGYNANWREKTSGVAQWLACWAHNPKVQGSQNPAPLGDGGGCSHSAPTAQSTGFK